MMVISSEGYFYSYNIDLENGGECVMMKQYRCVGFSCSVLVVTFVGGVCAGSVSDAGVDAVGAVGGVNVVLGSGGYDVDGRGYGDVGSGDGDASSCATSFA